MEILESTFFKTIPMDGMDCESFVSYYKSNKDNIEQELNKHGVLKFQGIEINNGEDFKQITDSIAEKFVNYIDGTSPRTKVKDHVYTSTEYDATQRITMHNELSYSAVWPNRLYFTCIDEPETGGETLIASSVQMLEEMDASVVAEVEAKGVIYIRNLHAGQGIGLSWKDAFETNDKAEADKHCNDLGIEYKWRGNDELQLIQRADGILKHRTTGQKLWFNQIDQFHPHQLGDDIAEAMEAMFDSPEDYPTYVKYGDGTEISVEVVKEILATSQRITIAPKWQKNELLVVDNELASHGRNPYTGSRKVLVAMSK